MKIKIAASTTFIAMALAVSTSSGASSYSWNPTTFCATGNKMVTMSPHNTRLTRPYIINFLKTAAAAYEHIAIDASSGPKMSTAFTALQKETLALAVDQNVITAILRLKTLTSPFNYSDKTIKQLNIDTKVAFAYSAQLAKYYCGSQSPVDIAPAYSLRNLRL